MAYLAFVCPPFLGHLNPMAALARALEARGHRVTVLGIADLAPTVAGLGLDFRTVCRDSHPPGTLAAVVDRMARPGGPLSLLPVIRDMAFATDALCRELPDAFRAMGADCVVADQLEPAGFLAATHRGLPVVTVANALPVNREPLVPPPFVGWAYDPSAWGRERNRGADRIGAWLMRPHARVIAEWAGRWHLGARRDAADCLSPLAEITQMVPGFDFPRVALPDTVHPCGPLRDPSLRPAPIDLPDTGGRPLVFATLGSLQGGRAGLFRLVSEATRQLDAALVIAHGGRLSPEAIRRLPGRPFVHAFVDQAQVLGASAAAIVNGGLNTVLDALAAGVPPLVVPLAFEQAATGARVARSRAGRCVSRHGLTAARLARTLDDVLRAETYRTAARRLGRELAEAGGAPRGAELVEAVLAAGRPVTRDGLAAAAHLAAVPDERAA